MTIKFICTCGKHLRAREDMAARRTVCPRCGAPVGIPSLEPTHRGTPAAPMSPDERRRRQPLSSDELSPYEDINPLADFPNLGLRPAQRDETAAESLPIPPPMPLNRPRRGETRWYHCLLYPLRALRLLFGLTMALTIVTALGVLIFPSLRHEWFAIPLAGQVFVSAFALLPFLVCAYTCGTLECALTSALAGTRGDVYWPGGDVALALKSLVRWLVCFLAGPAVLVTIACYYWVNGGDLAVLDWVILAELVVLAGGYWLLALVAVCQSERLQKANPFAVAGLLHRLGFRAVVPALVAPLGMLLHFLGAFVAVELFHAGALLGLFLLAVCWGSGLFWGLFVFRLLGMWCDTPRARAA
jgi:hypothetical protein